MSLGAKAVNDTSAQSNSWTPEVSGIYSGVFADGKFGVALSAIYQEREFGYNQASVPGGWFRWDQTPNGDWRGLPGPEEPGYEGITNPPGPNDTYSMPQQLAYSLNELERERLNGQLVLQWRPVEALTLTLDYTYSELEIQQKFNDLSAWFNQIPFESTWTDGPVAAPVLYREARDPPWQTSPRPVGNLETKQKTTPSALTRNGSLRTAWPLRWTTTAQKPNQGARAPMERIRSLVPRATTAQKPPSACRPGSSPCSSIAYTERRGGALSASVHWRQLQKQLYEI